MLNYETPYEVFFDKPLHLVRQFAVHKKDNYCPRAVQSIHHKNHIKKVIQIFLNNSILNLLGIEDQNIKDLNVETTSKNNDQLKVIHASLSYPVSRYINYGFKIVVKNGFRKTHLRLASLNGMRYEMILAKQRYYCSNCQTTFGATTDLTKPNQTLTRKLKSQIMLFAHEGMNGELIAHLCHCSPSSVRQTIIERVKPHYRMAVLPKHLCFDEFRSTKSIVSFICCDSESHQLVVKLHNRLSPSIIDYFENHRYSQTERALVIDLNAQYQSFIYRLFPNAQIIIDRFHIVQLAG